MPRGNPKNTRPCCKEANGMAVYLKRAQELDQIICFLVLILLYFESSAPSECIMSELHGLARVESTPENLLEVLDIDSGVVVMEAKKRLITCMVVQKEYPRAIPCLGIGRIVF